VSTADECSDNRDGGKIDKSQSSRSENQKVKSTASRNRKVSQRKKFNSITTKLDYSKERNSEWGDHVA
jgi:hypothetical protein